MNLDELQSVQSRERQASSLQHLRSSFYEEAADYVGELRAERNQVAARSDNPFDDPDVDRLSDEIRTAERTVESIYERRVGKVVKLASIAAADMPYDDEGLTKEEEQLFGTLVDTIEENRERVLSVLDGESPALDCTPAGDRTTAGPTGAPAGTPDGASGSEAERSEPEEAPGTRSPEPAGATDAGRSAERSPGPEPDPNVDENRPTPPDGPTEGTDPTPTEAAADADGATSDEPFDIGSAMGGLEDAGAPVERAEPTGVEDGPSGREEAAATVGERPAGASGGSDDGERSGDDREDGPIERTMVRVTADVGSIFGIDGRSYDLSAEDVVTLPVSNAENLVSKDAAERLD